MSRDRDLEHRLRRNKPQPTDDLVNRLEHEIASSRSERRGIRLRLVPALVISLALLIVVASVGGMSDAQGSMSRTVSSAVRTIDRLVTPQPASRSSVQRAQAKAAIDQSSPAFSSISNYSASHFVYPRPKLRCIITASSRKMRVSGVTTVRQGTISVTIADISGATANFPWSTSLAVTSFFWGPTSQSPQGKRGHTYRATATQTAAGYQPGTTSCYIRFHSGDGGGDEWHDY